MDCLMIYGPFDLSDATLAYMSFRYWIQTQCYEDYFQWGWSGDGSYFAGDADCGDYASSWKSGYLDLAPVMGDRTVWVGFHFLSNGIYDYPYMKGVFVDDIVIKKYRACTIGYAVGNGIGVINNTQNHIDTYCSGSGYGLIDVTRRASTDPHGHDGEMPDTSSIQTFKYLLSPTTPLGDLGNNWNDTFQAAAVDAHVYAGLTYDYMNDTLEGLGRNSFDSLGKSMLTTVDDPTFTNDAGFNTTTDRVHVYQAGSARRSYAGALDLIAHEWGHGILKYTSQLTLRRESGALKESFGDMLGVAVAHANGDQDWIVGESTYIDGRILRDMAEPNLSNPHQPDTYGGTFWVNPDCPNPHDTNDFCGVHTNMGVPNKMFYLLANGGTHNGVTVTGIEIDNAMKIMYEANKKRYWKDSIDFVHAASGSIRAAFDLNYYSPWPQQTSYAWTAVNVCTVMPGDLDTTNSITTLDVVFLVNYIFDKDRPPCLGSDPGNCWTPAPFCRGDANGDSSVTIGDIIYLINYVYDKDRLPCLGTDPISCWLPFPSNVCCKLP